MQTSIVSFLARHTSKMLLLAFTSCLFLSACSGPEVRHDRRVDRRVDRTDNRVDRRGDRVDNRVDRQSDRVDRTQTRWENRQDRWSTY